MLLLCFSTTIFSYQQVFCFSSSVMQSQTFDIEFPPNIKVITNTAKIFELPNLASEVLQTAIYNDEFTVVNITENFYKIQVNETEQGYVLTAFCMDSNLAPLEVFLDTNATITLESDLFLLSGSQYLKVNNLYLPTETRIKLINGFNETSLYTKASISLNGESFTYYIPTENIDPDGISTRTIIAFMLIITSVTIFLILYSFFKGKKVKG